MGRHLSRSVSLSASQMTENFSHSSEGWTDSLVDRWVNWDLHGGFRSFASLLSRFFIRRAISSSSLLPSVYNSSSEIHSSYKHIFKLVWEGRKTECTLLERRVNASLSLNTRANSTWDWWGCDWDTAWCPTCFAGSLLEEEAILYYRFRSRCSTETSIKKSPTAKFSRGHKYFSPFIYKDRYHWVNTPARE